MANNGLINDSNEFRVSELERCKLPKTCYAQRIITPGASSGQFIRSRWVVGNDNIQGQQAGFWGTGYPGHNALPWRTNGLNQNQATLTVGAGTEQFFDSSTGDTNEALIHEFYVRWPQTVDTVVQAVRLRGLGQGWYRTWRAANNTNLNNVAIIGTQQWTGGQQNRVLNGTTQPITQGSIDSYFVQVLDTMSNAGINIQYQNSAGAWVNVPTAWIYATPAGAQSQTEEDLLWSCQGDVCTNEDNDSRLTEAAVQGLASSVDCPIDGFQITGIDLTNTTDPSIIDASISYIDQNGNAQTTTDPTPITLPDQNWKFELFNTDTLTDGEGDTVWRYNPGGTANATLTIDRDAHLPGQRIIVVNNRSDGSDLTLAINNAGQFSDIGTGLDTVPTITIAQGERYTLVRNSGGFWTVTAKYPLTQNTPDVVTTLGSGAVDVTDPQNPIITLNYVNEDASQAPLQITVPIPVPAIPSLSLTSESVLVDYAAGQVNANGTAAYSFNSASSLLAGNVYQVTFTTAHPDGTDYAISLGAQSNEPANDQRKIQYLNKTANGFQVKLSVDDNGGAADPEVQSSFDYRVSREISVVTGGTLS